MRTALLQSTTNFSHPFISFLLHFLVCLLNVLSVLDEKLHDITAMSLSKQLTDFHRTWNEQYVTVGHPNIFTVNFVNRIKTWQTRELVLEATLAPRDIGSSSDVC
jgi:hypothetical protein